MRPDVDIVHIATPPFTHRDLALRAFARAKHVLCEKPLALTRDDAEEMLRAAAEAERVLGVNLIMRYDPLCAYVKQVLERRLLGEALFACFDNWAGDESLPPNHWFWDRSKSGGIFVEHAVHFFDLFEWWLGPGKVVSAEQSVREPLGAVDQVSCTVRHGTTIASHYHGFTQANRMDRQQMRILCETGSIMLDQWVPSSMSVDAIVSDAVLRDLVDLMPGARVDTLEKYEGPRRHVTSRHKSYEVDGRVRIEHDTGLTKLELYGKVLRDLIADQIAAIRDPRHVRRVSERNGLTSLGYAVEADALAGSQ
jgi:predicted dehydrogenase